VFHHFTKHHIKILLGDFKAELGREGIFKPITGMRVYIRIVMITMLK